LISILIIKNKVFSYKFYIVYYYIKEFFHFLFKNIYIYKYFFLQFILAKFCKFYNKLLYIKNQLYIRSWNKKNVNLVKKN